MTERIRYKTGYKYQLVEDYATTVPIQPVADVVHDFFTLTTKGRLCVKEGYAWDGASGPTIDTNDSMRASLVHDVLYQMIRDRLIPAFWRDKADDEFHKLCLADGMVTWRAWLWFQAVTLFGSVAVRTRRPIQVAPDDLS